VLDIANAARPVEVSRLTFEPHWTGWDAKTNRLVVTGTEPRLYLLKFDPANGTLSTDEAFHDTDGKPGFNFADRDWPWMERLRDASRSSILAVRASRVGMEFRTFNVFLQHPPRSLLSTFPFRTKSFY